MRFSYCAFVQARLCLPLRSLAAGTETGEAALKRWRLLPPQTNVHAHVCLDGGGGGRLEERAGVYKPASLLYEPLDRHLIQKTRQPERDLRLGLGPNLWSSSLAAEPRPHLSDSRVASTLNNVSFHAGFCAGSGFFRENGLSQQSRWQKWASWMLY